MITKNPTVAPIPLPVAAPLSRVRVVAHLLTAALTPITAATLILVNAPAARFIVLCLTAALVPGAAVLARSRFRHVSAGVALVIIVSLTVDACAAIGLLWARWFHPAVPAAVLGAGCSLWLLVVSGPQLRARRPTGDEADDPEPSRGWRMPWRIGAPNGRWQSLLWAGPLVASAVLWAISLSHTHIQHLGASGLIGVAPATWWLALGIGLAGILVEVWRARTGWLIAGYLGMLALILIGTIPALASAPEYAWVYKHIAVISLFEARGSAQPSVDIYNHYPGMFALAAVLSKLSGLAPLAYANWVQVVFTWLVDLLVFALAYTIVPDLRVAALTALLYLCANWIGQIYMSPQTLALALFVGFILLLVGERGRPSPSPMVARVMGWISRRFGGRRLRWLTPDARTLGPVLPLMNGRLCVVLLLAIDFVINATHQLTPYMLLIAIALLVITRTVNGWWLFVGCAVVTFGYLAANFSYLNHNFPILGSVSLESAVSVSTGLPLHRSALYADSGFAVTLAMLMTTFASALVLLRRGEVQRVVLLLALALTPALILGGQDYGGEGPLRVFLFSLPWQAMIVALAFRLVRARLAALLLTAIVVTVTGLMILTTLGQAGLYVNSADEVQAAEYINDHIRDGAAVVTVGEGFPTKIGARYGDFVSSGVDSSVDVFDDLPILATPMSPSRTAALLAGEVTKYAPYGAVVFSTSEYQNQVINGVVSLSRMRAIEAAVASSPQFTLWYKNADTRIYRLSSQRLSRQ